MESKIVCRKCKGPHLTIKCGKENENKIENLTVTINKEEKINGKNNSEGRHYNNSEGRTNYRERRDTSDEKPNNRFRYNDSKKIYKVKINYLPIDITEEELLELLYEDCGLRVSRIKVNNYEESANSYIEFRTEEEVKWIVEALHKTAFDNRVINVEQIFD